jgi:glycosyltransferase involved in cell wall biosynthesis
MNNPKVSIGIPVYNGEKYLPQAIESVLAQTFHNFELIITDNCSTDRTQEICEAYAAQDERVRYIRNEENLGAGPNFNRVFELAKGEYFQWLAADDVLMPTVLEKCVPVLDGDKSAVLCFFWVKYINEEGESFNSCELELRVDSEKAGTRFHEIILGWHNSFYVFGLIRASALRRTKLILAQTHGDTILIARLSLLGRFLQIPEYLFLSRYHDEQSNQIYKADLPCGLDTDAYEAWYDTSGKKRKRYPHWQGLSEFRQTMKGLDLSLRDRLVCYSVIGRFALRHLHCLLWDFGGLPRRFVIVFSSIFLNKNYGASQRTVSTD